MEIKRGHYLEMLRNRKQNGFVKVITGISRCGKSYCGNMMKDDFVCVDENIVNDKVSAD